MKPKKGPVVKIRPYAGDREIAAKISSLRGIDVITVMSLALSAGLRAIKANNYNLPAPLTMTVMPAGVTGKAGEPIVRQEAQPGQYPEHSEVISLAADETGPEYKTRQKK
jgi:hypothetical protein